MQPLVEPGSFVWGFVSGAAFTFVGVMTWALCASAKMGDRASEVATRDGHEPWCKSTVPVALSACGCGLKFTASGVVKYDLDAEARQYEQAESMGRDLPPAA